ncbi:MAG TPA: hypothetical protein VJ385_14275 [Fibrobacteria bacterium]|nr:hypothetical protein [Fibrobacteria bacterium]
MGKHKQSVDGRVWQSIQSQQAGWVFTPSDFLDLGTRTAVATAFMISPKPMRAWDH